MTAQLLEISDLKRLGLSLNISSSKSLGKGFTFEAPARTNRAVFGGKCHVGAFTYFADGRIYNTDFGRYCSIAAGVVIGHSNHPTRWLSTNPFQYQQSYKWDMTSASGFAHRAKYEGDVVDAALTRKAHAEVLKRTVVGNDVWVGNDAIIIAGVTIGDGAIIGAGAVVTKDVAPYETVGGVPAKRIGSRFDDASAYRIIASRWWEYAPWQLRHIDFSAVDDALQAVDLMRLEGVEVYKPEIVHAN